MPTHPLVVGLSLSAAHSILGCYLFQPVINAVKSHIHGRQLGQNLLLESIRIGTPACLNMGRTCSIRIGLIGLLLSPSIRHISHISSTRPLLRDLLPHSPHSCRRERLHTRSPGRSQDNLLCSSEDPREIRPKIQSRTTHEEFRRATVGAPEHCGAICEFLPEFLNIRDIGISDKLLLLRELLYRAETHQVTQVIRTEPEHRMANVKLNTDTTSEAIKFCTGGAAGCFCATDFFLLRARICKQLTPKISME
nr:hypothetical protein Iba_chr03cCG6870 [Ipomoea batatas]